MKINLMTDYAIRIIKSISQRENSVITSKIISEREKIPHGVLMKVLHKLRVNDMVVSHQGRGEVAGGYSLKVPVDRISILDIIEIMEGPIELSKNFEEIKRNEHLEMDKAQWGIQYEYERITKVIREELGRYTILDIINGLNQDEL